LEISGNPYGLKNRYCDINPNIFGRNFMTTMKFNLKSIKDKFATTENKTRYT
jgi:hypothetical protein